jgi:hypothetical protein
LRTVFAAVWKCTTVWGTFTFALAFVASSKGAEPAARLPANIVRREISVEPMFNRFFIISSLARRLCLALLLVS